MNRIITWPPELAALGLPSEISEETWKLAERVARMLNEQEASGYKPDLEAWAKKLAEDTANAND
jgi:hypothetical protein